MNKEVVTVSQAPEIRMLKATHCRPTYIYFRKSRDLLKEIKIYEDMTRSYWNLRFKWKFMVFCKTFT